MMFCLIIPVNHCDENFKILQLSFLIFIHYLEIQAPLNETPGGEKWNKYSRQHATA